MAGPPERDAASGRGQALVIETPRLLIRLPRAEDAPAYFDIHADPDVTRWLGGATLSSVDEETARIERNRIMHEELGFTMWAVEEQETTPPAPVSTTASPPQGSTG